MHTRDFVLIATAIVVPAAVAVSLLLNRWMARRYPHLGDTPTPATEPEKHTDTALPRFRDKERLMNHSEQNLYNALTHALPNALVFPQVSVSQMLHLDGEWKAKNQQLNVVARLSVDFVVCRASDTSIVLAIEVNGPHHDRPDRKKKDEKKRAILQSAGIPLLTLRAGEIPPADHLRATVANYLQARKLHEAQMGRCYDTTTPQRDRQQTTPSP